MPTPEQNPKTPQPRTIQVRLPSGKIIDVVSFEQDPLTEADITSFSEALDKDDIQPMDF
jgi:hypothetical protein